MKWATLVPSAWCTEAPASRRSLEAAIVTAAPSLPGALSFSSGSDAKEPAGGSNDISWAVGVMSLLMSKRRSGRILLPNGRLPPGFGEEPRARALKMRRAVRFHHATIRRMHVLLVHQEVVAGGDPDELDVIEQV